MTIEQEKALGNSVRSRLGELMVDLDNFCQIERHCTDDITWSREATHLLNTARRDILNLIGDAGFDKRIKVK